MPAQNAAQRGNSYAANRMNRDGSRTPARWREPGDTPAEVLDYEVLDLRAARHERVQRELQTARQRQQRREEYEASHAEAALEAAREAAEYEPETQRQPQLRTVPHAAPKACPPCHWGLIVVTLLLAVLSVPFVYSASTALALDHYKNVDFFLIRQVGFAAAGLTLLVVASRLSARGLRALVWVLYGATLLGLLAVAFTPLGVSMGGVRRWLKLGPILIQFSELGKIALIGVLADFWSRAARASQKSMWPWVVSFAIAAPFIVLVFRQPHLSAALLLFLLPFAIAFYAGVPGRQMVKTVTPLVALVIVVFALCKTHQMPLLKPYQQDRIVAFASGGEDRRGANYQVMQGMRALTRGGVIGSGPGGSLYKQGHLPAPHTDFILAVIGEEWGLVGMVTLITLYGTMIFFCFQIGHNAGKPFEALLCAGVGTLLSIQVICNAAVVTGLMPVTGVPLPLLSYGGSGLMCTLLGIGLVLSVSRQLGCIGAGSVSDSEEDETQQRR
ncbi:MAG TPA: putative peptidoglycan glycosyltransferase FtsW [Abditibacteriaceae bacterium]|nr:putative peptidoglycan glycosyltransferase FtsW [Abditibacteriaceae bacterium]